MAIRGRRPKSLASHVVEGTFQITRHAGEGPVATGTPVKPKLTAKASAIWDRTIARWTWLTAADSDKLAMYAILQAEFETHHGAMRSQRLAILRRLASDLNPR